MPNPSLILDPAADINKSELTKLAKRYNFPDFVKSADMDSTMNPSTPVPITAYADPVRKKFACQSAPATWLSAIYFHEKSAEYHPKDQKRICERFEQMADYFAIRPAYDSVVKRAKELQGSDQLPDSSYAYVWQSDDGAKERYYPLTSPLQVKSAAEWLYDNRDRMPFAHRNTIGNKILEKAARYGASLGDKLTDFVEKQAGQGIPDPPELYTMLERRSALAKSQEHRDAIMKLASAIRNTPHVALQPPELVKLATTVDIIDNAIGLRGKYTSLLPRPEDVIFKVTYTKAAADMSSLCAMQTGNIYDKGQLSKLAREDVEGLFGTDFANEVCTGLEVDVEKIAEIAATLPRPDAELLEQLLTEAGQHPQMNKGASWEPISNEVLEELAALYQ
jgi:hypothetical protein